MDGAQAEEDFSRLSTADRLNHSHWKARLSAYEEIGKIFRTRESSDPHFIQFSSPEVLKRMVCDANVVSHEAACSSLVAFLQNCDSKEGVRCSKGLVDALVERGIGSNRSGTKAKALEALELFIELESRSDYVLSVLINGMEHKTAKFVASCVNATLQVLVSFGGKVVDVALIIRALSRLFGHSDQSVRGEAVSLVREIVKYQQGRRLLPSIYEKLKPIQVKELEEIMSSSATANPPPEPKRLTRSAQVEAAKAAPQKTVAALPARPAEAADDVAMAESETGDDFAVVASVNPLPFLAQSFFDGLASSKWKDKKDALDAFLEATASARRFDAGNYTEIISAISSKVSDINIQVAISAASCLERFIKCCRREISGCKNLIIPCLLDRLKEKKASVTEALRRALDAFCRFSAQSISDVLPDAREAMGCKNPLVKSESLLWISRAIAWLGEKQFPRSELKATAESVVRCLEDSVPEVRDSACECFAALLRSLGEKALAAFVERIDANRLSKIRELAGALGGKSVESIPEIAKTKPVVKKIEANDQAARVQKAAEASQLAGSRSADSIEKMSAKSQDTSLQITYRYVSEMEVSSLVSSTFSLPEDSGPQAFWKERLIAVESICENLIRYQIDSEAVVRFLGYIRPTWKDINGMILAKVLQTLETASKKEFTKAAAALSLLFLIEKQSDPKLAGYSSSTLANICGHVGASFLIDQACQLVLGHRNPRVLADALRLLKEWIAGAVDASELKTKRLLDFARSCAANSNASVRSETVAMLCKFQSALPEIDLKSQLSSLPSNFLATLDQEMAKLSVCDTSIPSRPVAMVGKEEASECTPELIASCSNTDWQQRRSALEAIGRCAKRGIDSSLFPELSASIRSRLSDSNKQVCLVAVETLGSLSTLPNFISSARSLLPLVFPLLADSGRPQLRTAAALCFSSMLSGEGSADSIVSSFISSCLSNENSTLRKEFATWFYDSAVSHLSAPALVDILAVVAVFIVDKNSDVRRATQLLIGKICDRFGSTAVREKLTPKTRHVESFLFNSGAASATTFSSPAHRKAPASPRRPDAVFFVTAPTDALQHRLEQFNNRKPAADALRQDALSESLALYLNSTITGQLLNTNDFREPIQGMQCLIEYLRSSAASFSIVASCCDLLLRYTSIKVSDTNTSIYAKAFELCESLLMLLSKNDYKLSDYEAACYLSSLIQKLGDTKETFKGRLHELLRLSCHVYPASKILLLLVNDGLRSKNAKARLEALGEILWLMERHGCSSLLSQPAKSLPIIAGCVPDRDAAVRSAALRVLSLVYTGAPDGASLLQKFVFPLLATKERDFLEERFKRIGALPTTPKKDPVSQPLSTIQQQPTQQSLLPLTESQSTVFCLDMAHLEAEMQTLEPKPIASIKSVVPANEYENFDFVIAHFTSQDSVRCLDAVTTVYTSVVLNNGKAQLFLARSEELLAASIVPVRQIMNGTLFSLSSATSIRFQVLAKVLEIVEHTIRYFARTNLTENVATIPSSFKLVLQDTLGEFIRRLVDGSTEAFAGDAANVIRLFNDIVIVILDVFPKSVLFSILLGSLKDHCLDLSSELSVSLANLVMKCLWKVTKAFSSFSPDSIDAGTILKEISHFYRVFPSAEWRRRVSENVPLADLPHRTVKAILNELFKMFDEQLFPLVAGSEMEYVRLSLLSIRDKQVSSGTPRASQAIFSSASQSLESSQSALGAPSPNSADFFRSTVEQIFTKLTDKNDISRGIRELAQFRLQYQQIPLAEITVNEYLGRCSAIFQRYIRSQLETHSSTLITESKASTSTLCSATSRAFEGDSYVEKLSQFKRVLDGATMSAQPPNASAPPKPEQPNSVVSATKQSSLEDLKERLERLKSSVLLDSVNK